MRTQPYPRWRTYLVMGLLLAALVAIAPAPAAQAALSGCRADPVFILSDGTVLDVSVAIGTAVSNVDEIHYVVHGPRGTQLVTALSTPTLGFSGLETVTYVADADANQYITDTLVRTSVRNVSTTAYTVFAASSLNLSLRLRLGLTAQYHEVEGLAGQHLIAILYK